jgi:CheY-like chemotaxis protein
LIDDLLDITRITQGKLLVDLQLVEANKVLREALAKVKDEIEAKAIRLEVTFDPLSPMVRGDPARLQQVFWNVLKNAAKFTPHAGEIKVSTSIKDRQLVVVVADNGIGMTPEELRRIFAPFEQGDHATEGNAREFSGLGLGLSIARTMISHHSGTIEGASAGRGRGAVFTITLPLAEQTAEEAAAPVASPPAAPSAVPVEPPSRILLVEDDVSSRTALARLLTRRNYEVVCAGSGAEALAAAAQQKFSFVISDIGLPEQDGYSLMKQLRQRHGLKGIALTGYGTRDDIASSETAGFVAHLTKPVSISTLERAIEELKQENAKFSHIEGS